MIQCPEQGGSRLYIVAAIDRMGGPAVAAAGVVVSIARADT
jgi:hypothetical protein